MRWFAALIVVGLALMPGRAQAACPNCQCDASVSSLNFGTYNPVDPSPTRVTAALQISCANIPAGEAIGVNVALSGGKGSYAQRQMIQGSDRLGYNLYADPAHTAVWGNGADGSTEVGSTVAGSSRRTLTIFGEIPALQAVPAGAYFDIIVATVSY
jgi:spore coat protein U-like protein